ncbi:Uncharacterized protein TCM_041003 [Theobroma cacao]|uniref:Uncharacterized protein n=1 Tax=Theobroma cacao TaxID=3641 RepID=A0A061GT10_THECC|nr:Uncharacterized protein TCM_041003 [Theobroma cacao]
MCNYCHRLVVSFINAKGILPPSLTLPFQAIRPLFTAIIVATNIIANFGTATDAITPLNLPPPRTPTYH